MENYSFVLFMATLAIVAAIPTRSDRLCHVDDVTHSPITPDTKNGQQLHGHAPAIGIETVTNADSSLHRTGDATVDQMPRDHSYAVPLGHAKEATRQSDDGYKYQTTSPIHALQH